MNLNQVTVAVHDINLAVDFYKTLGLIQIVSADHYARFSFPDGDATFSVYLDTEKEGLDCRSVVYFEHEALDSLVEELKSKGIKFDQEPTMQTYLWKEATLSDPSGNKIKLYWAGENRLDPPWKIQADN
ncbi:VOC family protein [Enterovibrio paralichthyis]|uniref:VOC family protein n=1 Tax=Enterovibrio paralichthyis TaxID=2853805 RepID=UPI001C467F8F|nr:VOC family protein [Enterovibrio paralichthyis]MBV7297352.1 VOC family protein [Enterovibrio paralichthyis]